MPQQHFLPSPAATKRLGVKLAAQIRPGSLLLLEGPLGSGKTTLVKGLARALGVEQPITSPTFVLRKRYPLRGGLRALNHLDAYRFHTPSELFGTLDEFLEEGHEVWVIEWGGKLRGILPNHNITRVRIEMGPKNGRTATVF